MASVNGPMIWLPRNCANCSHFDNYSHCALLGEKFIPGHIPMPSLTVCARHEPKDDADVQGAAV
jgi:hypothetical protein